MENSWNSSLKYRQCQAQLIQFNVFWTTYITASIARGQRRCRWRSGCVRWSALRSLWTLVDVINLFFTMCASLGTGSSDLFSIEAIRLVTFLRPVRLWAVTTRLRWALIRWVWRWIDQSYAWYEHRGTLLVHSAMKMLAIFIYSSWVCCVLSFKL